MSEKSPADSAQIEGRNAVIEAFRAGRSIDKLFVLEGAKSGQILTILRMAKKTDAIVKTVSRERLDQLSETGMHQGVIARAAAYKYAQPEDMLEKARSAGEDPFIIILDGIEDPHNLGAIIRTAEVVGAHGVIIPKHRSATLTPVVDRASAGALSHIPVAKSTNIAQTIEKLKGEGLWFICADMDGQAMYDCDLTGPVGLVIGNEGSGVSRLVREKCDILAAIPMKGEVSSLNASVAAGVMAFEILRQREHR